MSALSSLVLILAAVWAVVGGATGYRSYKDNIRLGRTKGVAATIAFVAGLFWIVTVLVWEVGFIGGSREWHGGRRADDRQRTTRYHREAP
jgi:hypothetical protein